MTVLERFTTLYHLTQAHRRTSDSKTRTSLAPTLHDQANSSRCRRSAEPYPDREKITAIRYPSRTMQKHKKTGYNLVIFQNLVNGSDFLEIVEGKKVVERWPK